MKYYVLFNPHAGNGLGEEKARALTMDAELCFCDMTKLDSYEAFFAAIEP